MDEYYRDADFFKPTGDGLMVIYELPFDPTDDELRQYGNRVLRGSVTLLGDFATLLNADASTKPFAPLPTQVGIGIALGTASRLFSGDAALDYSGRTLNLASRLMDYARPDGILVDGAFPMSLLDQDLQDQFELDPELRIRGVSPYDPNPAYFTKGRTTIPVSARRPLDEELWAPDIEITRKSIADFEGIGKRFYTVPLPTKPVAGSDIVLFVRYPKRLPTGAKDSSVRHTRWWVITHDTKFGQNTALIDTETVVADLRAYDLPDDWPLTAFVRYRER